ncbi:MAG TPA: TetR family transcriptional regulator [Thermoleophilaceae bacterium]|jgi:AcrR family transcriptional regulator
MTTTLAEATRGLLRDTVLDAVGELLAGRPWSDVTMGEVAERGGVSRQTLYNVFGGRRELAQAYVMREAERFMAATEEAIRADAHDPRAALASATELFLAAAAENPLVRAISSSDEGDELLPLVTTRGGPLIADVTARLADVIVATWPALPLRETRTMVESLVRLAISHAALPTASPRATADAIVAILGPYVDEMLGD